MYAKRIGAYQKNDVLTADPMQLVMMCYEAAIRNLKIAKERYAEKQYEAKAKAVQKAVNIIAELIVALDFEKGGNIARSLDSLYRYMIRRINMADVDKDIQGMDEVIGILSELQSAWLQAVSSGKAKQVKPIGVQSGAWV